jgi:CO/xanthine dehydrogenase FAD-binding subunit
VIEQKSVGQLTFSGGKHLMKPAQFDYYAPASVDEALDLLAELGYNGKVLAGGQSLVAAMNFRMARPAALVDLNNIPELSYIKPAADGGLAIGTMTRVYTVEHSPEVAKRFPLLPEVTHFIGHAQIRRRGSFGGAIAHADPSGQLPGISMVMNAKCLIRSKGKEDRWVDAADLIIGPFMTVIEYEDLLTEVVLPANPSRTGSNYQQVARQSGGYALAAVTSIVTLDDKDQCKSVRMILMGVSDMPILSQKVSGILLGQKASAEVFKEVAEAVQAEIDPSTDLNGTAEYRRELIRTLVPRSLSVSFDRANKGS